MTILVWYRQDLRTGDNPALRAAQDHGEPVIPVYLHAPSQLRPWAPGGASNWWLHRSLQALSADLARCGSRLILRRGDDCLAELLRLAAQCGATRVLWNRCYEPGAVARDEAVKAGLRAAGLGADSHNGSLLHEPWDVRTRTGGPFQVFTPFWRHCLALPEPAAPLEAPAQLRAPRQWPDGDALADLALVPREDWTAGLAAAWTPGSAGAHRLLQEFLGGAFASYHDLRNRPDLRGTSRLSPHLHFGELSPNEVWHATRGFAQRHAGAPAWHSSPFITELGWREFAYHLLYHFPRTVDQPLRPEFARFPWQPSGELFEAWRRGRTGYPIVDAGMRELWATGWMHNRVRMISASFLVKDLLQPWQHGARWFWDTLVDADLASNTLGWQWTAGCGADAAPFFRIFNPVLQGAKFDPEGAYVRRWVPEIARLPDAWLHQPWAAPPSVLASAGVTPGRDYPAPIVDHAIARERALAALTALRGPRGP